MDMNAVAAAVAVEAVAMLMLQRVLFAVGTVDTGATW